VLPVAPRFALIQLALGMAAVPVAATCRAILGVGDAGVAPPLRLLLLDARERTHLRSASTCPPQSSGRFCYNPQIRNR
jgi:hypothetical protein